MWPQRLKEERGNISVNSPDPELRLLELGGAMVAHPAFSVSVRSARPGLGRTAFSFSLLILYLLQLRSPKKPNACTRRP